MGPCRCVSHMWLVVPACTPVVFLKWLLESRGGKKRSMLIRNEEEKEKVREPFGACDFGQIVELLRSFSGTVISSNSSCKRRRENGAGGIYPGPWERWMEEKRQGSKDRKRELCVQSNFLFLRGSSTVLTPQHILNSEIQNLLYELFVLILMWKAKKKTPRKRLYVCVYLVVYSDAYKCLTESVMLPCLKLFTCPLSLFLLTDWWAD